MRFCDFFIEYKIGLKNIGDAIPWKDLPVYRKVFIITLFVVAALVLLFETAYILFQSKIYLLLFGMIIGVGSVILIVFSIIDSSEKNLKRMLYNHNSVYSYKRMNMLKLIFQKYGLDVTDSSTIDLLIKEAEKAQKKNSFTSPKKGIKVLGAAIASIIVWVAQKIAEELPTEKLVVVALFVILIIACLIFIIYAFVPIFQDIVYRDNSKYNELIYDLRQLKIFSK